jgi:hypothetical protein
MNAAASFASLAVGWAVAFAAWVLREVHGPGFGYVTDFAFMRAWPAAFAALAWLLFILPALRSERLRVLLADPRRAILAWPTLALVSYGVLVATWVDGARGLAWFPLLLGLVAGLVFPRLVSLPARPALVAAAPVAAILAFGYVVWPALEVVSPYTTYVYGAEGSRTRALGRILSRVRAGDRFADLAARYPRIFATPGTGMTGHAASAGRGFAYRVEFDEPGGAVTRVEIEPDAP